MLASFAIPPLALYFQPQMYTYHKESSGHWSLEFTLISLLCILVEGLYLKIIFTSPGYVPRGESLHNRSVNQMPDKTDNTRWCKKCDAEKPERAHHCSVCNRCVYRMDHHCPFTNCCVGLHNERWFVFWLMGIFVGCCYGVKLSWGPFSTCLLNGMLHGVESLSAADLTRCVVIGKCSFIFLPAFALLIFSGVLVSWHLFLIASNYTTIEFFRFRLGPLLGDRRDQNAVPACCGTGSPIRNLCAVLLSPPREA